MSTKTDFYQMHLDRVSRSFAFCIARLDAPQREWIGLAYLLCRVLDTIEDSEWLSVDRQLRAFRSFDDFIHSEESSSTDIGTWIEDFPRLDESERLLIKDFEILLRDFYALEPELKSIFHGVLHSMSRGMQFFCARRKNGRIRLRSLRELNIYCFFVAGVVGELLTRLALRGNGPTDPQHLGDAFHFGLFLQKINVLKDQLDDEKQGRFLVRSRDEVINSLWEHARRAIRYISHIPESDGGFKLFCSWSMGLAVASLPYMERAYHSRSREKIPRLRTREVLALIEKNLRDFPVLIEAQIRSVLEIPRISVKRRLHNRLGVLVIPKLYSGELSRDQLAEIV